jgi:hypothetical protein
MNRKRNSPDSPLNTSFSYYVNEAYKNGEFGLPEIKLIGDVAEHFVSEGQLGYTAIRRDIEGAVIFETLSGGGGNNVTSINNGELELHETPIGNAVFKQSKDTKIVAENNWPHSIPGDAKIPLAAPLETSEVKELSDETKTEE